MNLPTRVLHLLECLTYPHEGEARPNPIVVQAKGLDNILLVENMLIPQMGIRSSGLHHKWNLQLIPHGAAPSVFGKTLRTLWQVWAW